MIKCQFCKADARNSFFCDGCSKVLPICWDDMFSALGMSVDFDLDMASLRHNYYQRLERLHPDSFNQASEEERRLAQEYSAFLNGAYNALRQPWTRAEYMLNLIGPDHAVDRKVDQSLLLEVMEWREQMESLGHEGFIELQEKAVIREIEMLGKFKLFISANNWIEAWGVIAQFRFLKRFMDDLSKFI